MKKKRNPILFFCVIALLLSALSGCEEKEEEYVDVLVYHVDTYNTDYTKEEYEELLAEEGVLAGSFYGQAAYTSYFFEEGIDFSYNQLSGGTNQSQVNFLDYSHTMKSAELLSEEELNAGRLPENLCEVILYGNDESLLGQEFLVYFMRPETLDGYERETVYYYVGYTMKIVGLQAKEEKQIYFAEDFCRQMSFVLSPVSGIMYILADGGYGLVNDDECLQEITDFPYYAYAGGEYESGSDYMLYIDEELEKDEIALTHEFYLENHAVMNRMALGIENIGSMQFKIRDKVEPGGRNVFFVSREIYETIMSESAGVVNMDDGDYNASYEKDGSTASNCVMLRVTKGNEDKLYRELKKKGYSGVMLD